MVQVRPVIEDFAARMFGGFARRDQRAKGELYLRGLMLDGKRKVDAADGGSARDRSPAVAAVRVHLDVGSHRGTASPGRVGARVPDEVRYREKWRLALDMLDEIILEWGVPSRPVVGDAGYGDAAEFRLGLTERGLTYVLAVRADATAHLADAVPVTAA